MAFVNACTETEELGGGKHRSVISIKPIAYPGPDGYLRRITNVLGNTGNTTFPVGVDELAQFRLDTRLAGKSPLFYFGKGQSRVTLALLGANNVSGVVTDNCVLFPEAWNNADFRITISGHRLQQDVVLRRGHPLTFQFRIDSQIGFDPVTFSFGNDFRIIQPVLQNPKGTSMEDSILLNWIISQSGGKYILSVTLPIGDWNGWILQS